MKRFIELGTEIGMGNGRKDVFIIKSCERE